MKILILYASPSKLTDEHQPIETPVGTLYIRTEECESESLDEALDLASPISDEVMLNTINTPENWESESFA